jgi:hypothetical protein
MAGKVEPADLDGHVGHAATRCPGEESAPPDVEAEVRLVGGYPAPDHRFSRGTNDSTFRYE